MRICSKMIFVFLFLPIFTFSSLFAMQGGAIFITHVTVERCGRLQGYRPLTPQTLTPQHQYIPSGEHPSPIAPYFFPPSPATPGHRPVQPASLTITPFKLSPTAVPYTPNSSYVPDPEDSMGSLVPPLPAGLCTPKAQRTKSHSEASQTAAPATPKGQRISESVKVALTPNQTRFAVLKVHEHMYSNIVISNDVRIFLNTIASMDNEEELHNMLWSQKNPIVTGFINLDQRVLKYLAPVYRELVAQHRKNKELLDTPERSDIRHVLTIESLIHVLMYGQSYLSLPAHSEEFRLSIVAPVELVYSEAIRNQHHLDAMAWVTITFVPDPNGWRCIHYFFDERHPVSKCYRDGFTCRHPYFMEPLNVGVHIVHGKLSFTFNKDEFQACAAELQVLKAQEFSNPATAVVDQA